MSGFLRSFNQAYARKQENVIESFRAIACLEDVSARIAREAMPLPDPFGIADPCPANAGWQHLIEADCGDVVCVACGKMFA